LRLENAASLELGEDEGIVDGDFERTRLQACCPQLAANEHCAHQVGELVFLQFFHAVGGQAQVAEDSLADDDEGDENPLQH